MLRTRRRLKCSYGGNRLQGLKLIENHNPFRNDKFLDASRLKGCVDDSFKFDENARKFFKRVKNNVKKGEIARYEQFLLFPSCF